MTPLAERKKKCAKCSNVYPLSEYGKNSSSSDGYKSYCRLCTNALGKRRREINIAAKLKHHIATRVTRQLEIVGASIPDNLTKNLESYVGYPMWKLRKELDREIKGREGISLRQALADGYHIDHIRPLSLFAVKEIGDLLFRQCWAISNLRAIPAEENLAKGAKVVGNSG
ncbi:hypothetical protein LCGC14_1860670 [marine sediment metagenome]|uniref:Uncharacterized protein n=1 Tax=marine sediment metagenome TaxID=412755 RepID=A0A0F9GW22_9ZZZZ